MSAFSQENRLISISTPLGKDALLLPGFSGKESLSSLFSFELDLLSDRHNIAFEEIVGKQVALSIVLADGEKRYFNGIISRFAQGGRGVEAGSDHRYSLYTATMVPWLWLLTQTSDSRIFQELSVPDIISQIFNEKGLSDFTLRLQGSYAPRTYCVQYRETDFNFISRLMEEEGIYYFFEHDEKKHTLVLADSAQEHKPCPQQKNCRYQVNTGGWLEEDVISGLEMMQEIRPGKYTLNDYNFEVPATDLKVEATTAKKLGPGEREIYDQPGDYQKRNEGDRLVNIRMQEEEARVTTINGSSDCRAFVSGYRFTLTDHFRDDLNGKDYVLTAVEHQASLGSGSPVTSGGGSGASYSNSFQCIPFTVPYRPARTTSKPLLDGIQTAIVVGPDGEEIYTDEHGRVKVQFHWDREGKRDENSSCWIRVSQLWAGSKWGAMQIPRIGQEVIVDFLEGDPDRPIIIGRVYHGNNKPPYTLPDEKTKSTLKSDSSLGGEGFNELRFEDKKGEEQVYLQAEKNLDSRVKNDRFDWVGNDSHLIVKRDQLGQVEGDKHLTVTGDRNEKVNGIISREAAMNLQDKAGMAYALEAGTEIHLQAGVNVVIEAGVNITLKAGGSFVTLGPEGVSISGALVNINSGGSPGSGSGSSPKTPQLPTEADGKE